jgi:zinc transporter, ZIP family
MISAAFFGALSSVTLILGALLAYVFKPDPKLTAIVMALGSGLLIGSVAYDLVADAQSSISITTVAISLMAGAIVFVLGSRALERRGSSRKNPQPKQDSTSNPMAIVLGSALDGVPESFVLGLSVLSGGVSMPLLLGIGLSNIPEGMAASAGLRERKWPFLKVLLLWSAVVMTSAVSAVLGHEVLASDDGTWTGITQTFAAGALLAMISDTMLPESFAIERVWTGGLVVAGFSLSLLIAAMLGA